MNYAHARNADLNLLVALRFLVEERSVTRAARRMFLTQPAMSRVVDRLQIMFEDQLLVRTTKGYEPTHRALTIYAELQQVLPRIEALIRKPEFNPAKAVDVFKIEATDWGATALVPELIRILAKKAAGIHIDVIPKFSGLRRLENNEVDLVLTLNTKPLQSSEMAQTNLRTEFLFREKLVCLVREGHPLGRRRLTLRAYLKAQHVSLSIMQDPRRLAVSTLRERQGTVAQILDRLGRKRDVRVWVPYFSTLALIVQSTDLIATVPLQIASRLSPPKTHIIPAPLEFRGFSLIQVWHSRDDANPQHKWLRELIRTVARSRLALFTSSLQQ
jgi:DNA-binding transcriptional LysR family regulator